MIFSETLELFQTTKPISFYQMLVLCGSAVGTAFYAYWTLRGAGYMMYGIRSLFRKLKNKKQ